MLFAFIADKVYYSNFKKIIGNFDLSTKLGQARLDGAFCGYTPQDKHEYLIKMKEAGVSNIEMEATCFAALTHMAGFRAAIVCVTLVNRLDEDQVRN